MNKQNIISVAIKLTTASYILSGLTVWASTPQKLSQFPEGERVVYTHLVDAYQHNQLNELIKQRQLLESKYPLSIHLDNAYYMTGVLQFQQNHFAEAVQAFDVVRDRYTKSSKRPAALFALAMTYDHLKLPVQTNRVLESIIKEYPGSPESQRAWMHLRLAKETSAKSVKR